jgi:starch synthase (maltosyl-transferring)
MRTLRFHGSTDDEHLLVYSKTAPDGTDPVLVVVNLDPAASHEGLLRLDLGALGLPGQGSYTAHDELTGDTYTLTGWEPYVRLDPALGQVAHVLALRPGPVRST